MKQNTIDEPRLSECVELYESLGYEVHLEPATPSEFEECRKCYDFEDETATVKTIYIRPKRRMHACDKLSPKILRVYAHAERTVKKEDKF